MMNKLNLIILSITVVVIICIGIYLYKNNKNNQVNTEPFYQTASQAAANPITIADMATKISEPTQYLNLVFPATLVGSMAGTPVITFGSANASVINGLSNINTIDISPPTATYVKNSNVYSGNVPRLNEGSYMFLLDSLIDGTYQFNVTITGQNQSKEPTVSLNLFIEQLNQSAPSTILACSRSSAPTGGGYGTCSLNLIKSITASKPLNIRLTANSTLDIRLLNLSISILRIN